MTESGSGAVIGADRIGFVNWRIWKMLYSKQKNSNRGTRGWKRSYEGW
jgi:hypothetical protein